jgi:nucleotide-binding universal stress UspA family protein
LEYRIAAGYRQSLATAWHRIKARRCAMKILFTTDGSECSEAAARFLARFRFSADDEIMVLHAVPPLPLLRSQEAYYAGLRQIRQEIAPRILDAAVDCLKNLSAKISIAAPEGYPDAAILETAAGFGADVIAMGARGLKGIKSAFLGSVTRAVAISAPRPVLVVKSPAGKQSGPWTVLFATDGSDRAINTAKLLSSLPFPEGTSVTVMHVSPSSYMDIPEHFYLEVNGRIKDAVAGMKEAAYRHGEEVLSRSREALGTAFAEVTELIRSGDPSEVIIETAQSSGSDIIAVGSSGMGGVKGMLGSVSRRVLGHAECSILIGKQ